MYQIPYRHPNKHSTFPEDTILKEKDHPGRYTDYYVFVGKTLVRFKRVNRKGPHYREIRELKEKYGDDLEVRSGWNPLDYRVDEKNVYKSSVETPVKFVEVKKHETDYANNFS